LFLFFRPTLSVDSLRTLGPLFFVRSSFGKATVRSFSGKSFFSTSQFARGPFRDSRSTNRPICAAFIFLFFSLPFPPTHESGDGPPFPVEVGLEDLFPPPQAKKIPPLPPFSSLGVFTFSFALKVPLLFSPFSSLFFFPFLP